MSKLSSRKLIIYGFSLFMGMLIILGAIWTKALDDNNASLEKIVNAQIKRQLLFTMRDAAHKRAISLMRMASLSDPFDIDDEYMKFKDHAGNFISARDVLMAFYFSETEKVAWDKAKSTVKMAEVFQRQAAEHVIEGNRREAVRLLYEEIMPLQDIVSSMLTQFMDVTRDELDMEIGGSVGHNKSLFNFIAIMIGVVILFGGFATYIFIKKSSAYDLDVKKQNQRIRFLYELSSESGITTNEQLDKMLSLGCHLLGAEIGKICKIDEEVGTNTIMRVHSPQYDIKPGHTIPLEYTFCRIAFGRDGPIAINEVAKSEYKNYPCYEFSHLESYIATPIKVRGAKWGTVNFCSHYPTSQPFTDTDTDLVRLIGNWVSFMLEKQMAKSELHDAKVQAEEVSNYKSEFFDSIGRELKVPVKTIVEYSDTLVSVVTDSKDSAIKEGLERINASGEYLLSLVNDVLDLSVLEEGKMELHYSNFTLNEVVNSFVESSEQMLNKNNNEISVEIGNGNIILYTDVIRFKQVLFNTISAVSRLSKGGPVRLTASHHYVNTKGWLELKISESTSGISEEQLSLMLEPFWKRSSKTSSGMANVDIGLIISRQICRMMDGDITVKSLQGVGSTYYINLPVVVSDGLETHKPLAS